MFIHEPCFGVNTKTKRLGIVDSTKSTDYNGNTTTYTHDAMLRITSETDALGGTRTYTYDRYGNTLSVTDELGRTTVHEYDRTGRKTADILPDGTQHPILRIKEQPASTQSFNFVIFHNNFNTLL